MSATLKPGPSPDAEPCPLRNERCGDCAFTPGTEANAYEWTALKAAICVMAREPFFCHVGTERKLCLGWAEAVAFGKDEPEWRKAVARKLLDAMDSAQDGKPEQKVIEELYAALEAPNGR